MCFVMGIMEIIYKTSYYSRVSVVGFVVRKKESGKRFFILFSGEKKESKKRKEPLLRCRFHDLHNAFGILIKALIGFRQ